MKKLILIACAIAGFVGSSFAGNYYYGPDGRWLGFSIDNGCNGYIYGANGQYQGFYQNNGGGNADYFGRNGQYLGYSSGGYLYLNGQ